MIEKQGANFIDFADNLLPLRTEYNFKNNGK